MQHIVKNNDLRVTCNVKLLENVQASNTAVLSGGGCCTVSLSKHINGFITPESLVKSGCATIIVADNANESGSKMFQIPISGNQMISFLDSDNRIVVLAVGKSNIQVAISTSPFSMGQDLVFEKRDDVFKSDFITEIDDVKYRRIPLDTGRYVDKILVADKGKKVYTLEYDSTKSAFSNRREIRCMENVMGDDGLWAFYMSFVSENPEYTPADFMYYSNASNLCYTASDSFMTQDENHTDKNDMGFSHVNCIVPYGVYNGSKMQTESLLFAAAMKDSQRHRVYLQYAGFNTDVDDAIDNNPNADIYDISALAANDRDVSFVCAIGEDGDNHNVLYTGVIPNDYDSYKKSGMVRELSPIYSGVLAVFPCQASDDILTGFVVLDDGTLVRLVYSLRDDSVITRPVEIEDGNYGDELPTFNCYHTQLDLATPDGVALPSGNVTITSPYTCLFEIMGRRYAVKENHPLVMADIVSPTLYITQYADEIYTSEFGIKYSTKSIDGQKLSISCTINPSAENEDKISSMTPGDWSNATKQNDKPLIPQDYNSPQNMKALTSAISKITKATSCPTIKVEDCVKARKLSAENITEFALIFDKYQITYSDNGIHQLYLSLKAGCSDGSQLTGIFGWAKKKISSVIKAASKKIVEIAKVVVAKVGDAFLTVVEFIKDDIHYIIEEVLDFVSKAYDTVTAIFTRISVCFQDFMDWLGQLLHWDEVTANAALVKKTFCNAFYSWQSAVCGGIVDLQKGIGHLSEYFKKGLLCVRDKYGDKTLRDIINRLHSSKETKMQQEVANATANNIFFDGLIGSVSSTNADALRGCMEDGIAEIIEKIILELETNFRTLCTEATKLLDIIKGYDSVLDVPIREFLDSFANLSTLPVNTANVILDAIKEAVNMLFDGIKSLLEQRIDIPLFSYLFKNASGGMDCNMINIISLIVALPYTAVENIFNHPIRVPRLCSESDDDQSKIPPKVLAVVGVILTGFQKFLDAACSVINATDVPSNKLITVFKKICVCFTVFCDVFTAGSWLYMIFRAKENAALYMLSRGAFVVCGGILAFIDFATMFNYHDSKWPIAFSTLLTTFGGEILCFGSVTLCIMFYIQKKPDGFADFFGENCIWDSSSLFFSGIGNMMACTFDPNIAKASEYTTLIVGGIVKGISNYISIVTCIVSCCLTFNQPSKPDDKSSNFNILTV